MEPDKPLSSPASQPAGDSLNKCLAFFQKYLIDNNMSPHTITAYVYSIKHFYTRYQELTPDTISLYKVYLMDHYQPQTVNMRIRALNSFMKFQGIKDYKVHALRLQQKNFLDHVISQADYEYLKRRLWEDGQYTFYFIIRLITATGVRVSELVEFQVEDAQKGFKDIYSKGNKMRRVYIPTSLQRDILAWLASEARSCVPLFLSHLGRAMSISGIRAQLKPFPCATSWILKSSIPTPSATGLRKTLLNTAAISPFSQAFWDMTASRPPGSTCAGPARSKQALLIESWTGSSPPSYIFRRDLLPYLLLENVHIRRFY